MALATGLALPAIARGEFTGKAFAISLGSLGLSSTAVRTGAAGIKWLYDLKQAKRVGALARFGAGASRLARFGGWFYTAATRWILGVRLSFDGLNVAPCIPSDWEKFEVTRKWRGATFNIIVKNPNGVQKGVQAITLNGEPIECPIPPQEAGSVNEVVVMMG